ncbi:MAG: glycine dehydrogenase, partial [Bryobacteraceae bacterium]|nr:glycine dehydrogenase [Bryobacteraceae bacterium]
MRYLPKSDSERAEMLDALGVGSLEDLVAHLPPEVLLRRPLNLPPGKSEYEIAAWF